MQNLAPERPSRRLRPRLRPVHARQPPSVVAAERIFPFVDDDAAVEQAAANRPDERRQPAGREEVVDVDYHLGLLQGAARGARGYISRWHFEFRGGGGVVLELKDVCGGRVT